MDYLIFNEDGSIKHSSLNHYIQQGNSGVDKILLAKTDITSQTGYTTLAYFTLPDKTTNLLAGVWQNNAVEIEGTSYSGWVFTLTQAQTSLKGSILCSLTLKQGQTLLLSYPVALIVNNTGFKPDADSGMTVEEAQEFLVALQNYQPMYDASNIKVYQSLALAQTDLQNIALNQIVGIRIDGNFQFYIKWQQPGSSSYTLSPVSTVIFSNIRVSSILGTDSYGYITSNVDGDRTFGTSAKKSLLVGSQYHIPYNSKDLAFVIDVEEVQDDLDDFKIDTQDNLDDLEQQTQNKLDDKLKNVSFTYNGDTVSLVKTKTDTSSTTENIQLANSTTAGLMSPTTVAAIQTLTQDVAILKGQTARLEYNEKANPTAQDILEFVVSQGYTDPSKYTGIAVVITAEGTQYNHIWKWLNAAQIKGTWIFKDSVDVATLGQGFNQNFNFVSDNEQMDKIFTSFVGVLGLTYHGELNHQAYFNTWYKNAYKTIDCGNAYQNISNSFLTWLLANTDTQGDYIQGGFKDFGLDTVNPFTNSIAGIIKGSLLDGQIYAEDDATGSVNGWSTLKNRVGNLETGKLDKPLTGNTIIRSIDWDTNNEFVLDLNDLGIEVIPGDNVIVFVNDIFYQVYRISYGVGNTIQEIKFKAMITPEDDIGIVIKVLRG